MHLNLTPILHRIMNHIKSANMAQAQAILDYLVGQLLNEQMVNVDRTCKSTVVFVVTIKLPYYPMKYKLRNMK